MHDPIRQGRQSIDGLAGQQWTKLFSDNLQRCLLRTLTIRGVSGKAMDSRDSAYCIISFCQRDTPNEGAYRSGDIGTGDSLGSGIKEVESVRFTDLGNDLGSDTEC